MNKILAVIALVACAGCAETNREGRMPFIDMDHGPAVSADAPATRERIVASEPPVREPVLRSRPTRADGEWVVCAQCR